MDFQQIRKYVKGVLTNSFTNKSTLDKLSTSDAGNLLFNGEEIKSGGGNVDELLNKAAYLAAEEEVTELPTATESSYHNYSTEEKIIGTWIDGKPIYEKVISGTMSGSPADWADFYDCTELNIDTMIEIKGFFNYRDERSFMLNDRYSAFTYKYNTKIIQYYNKDLAGGLTFNVTAIIQYTKQE